MYMTKSPLDHLFPTQKEPAGNTAIPAIAARPSYIQGIKAPAMLTLISNELHIRNTAL